jgi:YfiH family protein
VTTAPSWIAADWPAPEGVVAGTTLRHHGVSRGTFDSFNLGAHVGDKAAAVTENRQQFRSLCNLPSRPFWLTQVHGTTVASRPAGNGAPEADAAMTAQAGVTCVVLTADCLPVLFASVDGREIGAAHAGWRGLSAGVLEATVAAFSSRPASLLAWLGPAISQHAFEVGAEVRQEFLAIDPDLEACFAPNDRGCWQADLYELARRRLLKLGVVQVSGGEYCTYGEPERFFSYRRDGQCGRMASFVYRRREPE